MEGNALDLPFPDSSFDAVTIGYGLRNVIDRHKAMTEICRVLKPGSTISILDFNKSINPLSTTIQVFVGRLIHSFRITPKNLFYYIYYFFLITQKSVK